MIPLLNLALALILVILLEPLVTYFRDKKHLRQFPNQNCLSGITNLGYILERCGGFRSKNLHQVHLKHPIVRIGPTSLSFSTPGAIRDIYGHSTACIKGDTYLVSSGPHAHVLDVVDKGEHARKRRYMSNVFASRNLETWEYKVVDKIERFASTAGGVLDFRKWSNLFTVEAIVDIAVSRRLGCLENGSDTVANPAPNGGKKSISYIGSLHADRRATTSWRRGRDFDGLLKYMAQEKIRQHNRGDDLDDLVRCMLQDNRGIARDLHAGEVEAELSVLMNAGSDTKAIALTNVMYHLIKFPSALDCLRKELDMVLSNTADRLVTYAQVKNLPYLRACLDESLRLSPPVAFGLNRKTPSEGIIIDGNWLPGGVTVGA
ncbi:cytochrome P450 [Aspergillus spectabilis]